jgi:hypothetical protein
MNVVIVGARERRDSEEDKQAVEQLLQGLVEQHGTRLHVLSVGCDKGVGKVVREYCIKSKIIFVEVRIKFEGEDIPRGFFAHMFLARNLCLTAVGDEYYIYTGPNENGIIEALVEPAKSKVGATRVHVFPA